MRYKIWIILFFILNRQASAQLQLTITPPIDTTVNCITPTKTIFATHPKLKLTTNYIATSIPYQNISLSNPTSITLGDDVYSGIIPIGFSFCFFGVQYNQCVIGSNGILAFNTAYANQPCYNNTSSAFPINTAGTLPNECIGFPFIDVDPSQGGTIQYMTTGVAPNRKFYVQFINVPLFGGLVTVNNNFYVVLHESTNVIETHIGNKGITNSNPPIGLDSAILGIQNASALNYLCPPNRNGGIWSTSNEAWRYTPDGAPGYTVQWYINGTQVAASSDSATLNFTASGVNQVLVKYTNSCPSFSMSDTIYIYKHAPIIDSVTVTQPICKYHKGTVVIHASTLNPPLLYNHNGGNFATNNSFTNLNITTNPLQPHVFNIKDASACVVSYSVSINNSNNLKVLSSNLIDANCGQNDGSVCAAPNSGVPPYNFLWSNGSTSPCATGLAGNTSYTVVVTDQVGCKDSLSIYIAEIKPVINIDSTVEPICPSGLGSATVSVTGNSGPHILVWQPQNDTSFTQNNLIGNTTYTLIAYDTAGCFSQTTLTLNYISTLSITATTTKPTCQKNNGSISTSISNGNPPFSYAWSNGSTSANLNNLDSNLYYVTVTDADGCSSFSSIPLPDTLDMTLNSVATNTACGYMNGAVLVNAQNGMSPITYNWQPGNFSGPNYINIGPGSYTVTVKDALNCIKISTLSVAPSQVININFNAIHPFCDSANGQIQAQVSFAQPPNTFTWLPGGPATTSWNNLAAGTYTFSVKDSKNCTSSSSITLIDKGSPKIAVKTYSPPLCHGDSSGQIELVGSGGNPPYKYSKDGINYYTSSLLTNIYAGTFVFYIRDASSCIRDTTITLSEPTKIETVISGLDTLICYNDVLDQISFATIGGFPIYQYKIDQGNYSTSTTYNNIGIGVHKLFTVDSVQCEVIKEFIVPGPALPFRAQAIINSEKCNPPNSGRIEVVISGGWGLKKFLWSDGETSFIRDQLKAGDYEIIYEDSLGCKVTETIPLKRDTCCIATLPNVFSPNNDLINDDIGIIALSPIESVELKIFNRWGQVVFETKDIKERWDGKLENKLLENDLYFYLLKYYCDFSDKEYVSKGEVRIIK